MASVVLRLALAQIVCNLLIAATGMGLLNVLFYLYAVMTLALFMRRTVASSAYTLKQETLVLERKLGDSTTSVVEIPLNHIIAVRPICAGERLHVCYRQVTVIDNEAKPTARMKAAWRASLFSAGLARKIARGHAHDDAGYAIVFDEADTQRRACVFRPDEAMCGALREALGERFGLDDRQTRPKVTTLYAQALERAFPELIPRHAAGQPRGSGDRRGRNQKQKAARGERKGEKPEKPAEGGETARGQTPQKERAGSKRCSIRRFFLIWTERSPSRRRGITKTAIYAAEKMGFTGFTQEQFKVFIGPPLYDSFRKVVGMTEEQANQAIDHYHERFERVGWAENEVYAGIPSLLRSLKKNGARVAIVTAKPQVFAERIAQKFGLAPYLDDVIGPGMNNKGFQQGGACPPGRGGLRRPRRDGRRPLL